MSGPLFFRFIYGLFHDDDTMLKYVYAESSSVMSA